MFKFFRYFAVCLTCFACGISFARFDYFIFENFDNSFPNKTISGKSERVDFQPGDDRIRIVFFGWKKTDDGYDLEMEVANDTSQTITYWSYEQGKLPHPEFKINGVKINQFYCGTGLLKFNLKPQEAIRHSISLNQLSYFHKTNKPLQIGFWLLRANNNEGEIYWSDNIPIPPDVENAFEKELSKNYSYIIETKRNLKIINTPSQK